MKRFFATATLVGVFAVGSAGAAQAMITWEEPRSVPPAVDMIHWEE